MNSISKERNNVTKQTIHLMGCPEFSDNLNNIKESPKIQKGLTKLAIENSSSSLRFNVFLTLVLVVTNPNNNIEESSVFKKSFISIFIYEKYRIKILNSNVTINNGLIRFTKTSFSVHIVNSYLETSGNTH